MNAREHHVVGQPPAWSRRGQRFRRFDGTLADRYMVEEERADDARTLDDWRRSGPAWSMPRDARPNGLVRRWIMWRAVRRQRLAFKRAYRNYRRHVRPMSEVGHSIVDSWYFLIPLGAICIAALVCRVMGWWS